MPEYRITIGRRDGTSWVRSLITETMATAVTSALKEYRDKHPDEPVDGYSHWVQRKILIKRDDAGKVMMT